MNTAFRFSKIEPGQQPQLIQEIRNILTEVGAHNVDIYNKAYWEWQYAQLPTGQSHVYAAWDGDRIIGYYHVPVYRCMIDGEEKLIGNIQDVAVNPNYRGGGLFRKLAEYANADLNHVGIDLIYTFPNDKSIHTFLKYNHFSTVSAVPTYLRPVNSGGIIRSKANLLGTEKVLGAIGDLSLKLISKSIKIVDAQVETIHEITNEVEHAFTEYDSTFRNHLIRDKDWLIWRYLRSPRGKHHVLAVREAGKITAVLVLKEDEMLGNPALLIMDHAFATGKELSLRYLIQQVVERKVLHQLKFNLVFVSGISPTLSSLRKVGFLPIPKKVNPRVLNLLARSTGTLEEKSLLAESNWLLTLGDWDVF
jgi:GNAT superfamily N-acetyltransferase